MKQLKFNLDNLFRLSTISAVQTFELENNSTELIISTDVKTELSYELHIESPEGKSFVILEKVDGAVKCLLNSGMLKLGVNKIQLRGVGANDYSIESNRVEFTVKSFINASVEPEPSEQTAFEKLVVEVNILKSDVDSLSDKIDSAESAVAALGTDLELEKVNRANSDSLLDSKIEAEREAREMEDSSIKSSIQALDTAKQDKLVAGENITIEGNVISAKGGGAGDVTKEYVDQQDEAIKAMIPSKTSELENDSGFITEVPEIPSKTSDLTNDSGFITDEALNGLVKSVNNVAPDEAGNVTIPTGGNVNDVQINGTSIVSDGVANITGFASQSEVDNVKADLSKLDENKVDKTQVASNTELGLVKIGGGLAVNPSTNNLYISQTTDYTLNNRIGGRALTLEMLDNALRVAMCDGKGAEWTDEEKANARARMGVGVGGKYELIEEFILAEDTNVIEKSAEPNGTPYRFSRIRVEIFSDRIATSTTYVSLNINGSNSSYTSDNSLIRDRVSMTTEGSYALVLLANAEYGFITGKMFSHNANSQQPQGIIEYTSTKTIQSDFISLVGITAYTPNSPLKAGVKIKIYGVRI